MIKDSQQLIDLFVEACIADAETNKPMPKGNCLTAQPLFLVCIYEDAPKQEKAAE